MHLTRGWNRACITHHRKPQCPTVVCYKTKCMKRGQRCILAIWIKKVTDWEWFLLYLCSNTPHILQIHISNCKTKIYAVIFTSNTHSHTHTLRAASPLLLSVATATQHSPSHLTNSTGAPTDLWQTHDYRWSFIHTNTTHLAVLSSEALSADAGISPEVSLHLCARTLLHLSHPTTDASVQTGSALAGVRRRAGGLGRAGAGCQRGPESIPHPEDEEERKYVALHESGPDLVLFAPALHTLLLRADQWITVVRLRQREADCWTGRSERVWGREREEQRRVTAGDDTHAPPLGVFLLCQWSWSSATTVRHQHITESHHWQFLTGCM